MDPHAPIQPAIATLTLNPSVDMSYELDELIPGEKSHATACRYDPGGNGINVARALRRLDAPVRACCVLAGESGALLRRLLDRQLEQADCVEVAGETRINCTVLQRRPPVQYEVSAIGPRLDAAQLATVGERFLDLAGQGFGVLTGSLPPGAPTETYALLAERLATGGGRAIVDAKDRLLKAAIRASPFLIKPNRYELEVLCGKSLPGIEDVALTAREIQAQGVTHVCVSLGAEGALLVSGDNTYYAPSPKVRVRCTVGAGDSMLAGMLLAFATGRSPADALVLGLACGSGTASHPGTELFDPGSIEHLGAGLQVRQLDI